MSSATRKNPAPIRPLRIGVYGCTQAGKTRFLFQLLRTWEKERRLSSMTPACRRFLETVEVELEKHGRSTPTASASDEIGAVVRWNDDEPEWSFAVRDLRGEMLSDELDAPDAVPAGGEITSQVRDCHGFLFFFDPACSENPRDIVNHHQRERDRAKRFIEHVFERRQNRLLPILFVATHVDLWMQDREVTERFDQWLEAARTELASRYQSDLKGLQPTTYIEKEQVCRRVSSVDSSATEGERPQDVVIALADLVKQGEEYRRRRDAGTMKALIAALGFLVVGAMLVILMTRWEPSSPPPIGPGSKPLHMGDNEVGAQLKELDGVLKVFPSNGDLPKAEIAANLNRHLDWMVVKLGPPLKELPEETQDRLTKAMANAIATVGRVANGHSPALDRKAVLENCLRGLPSTPDLAKLQDRYWEIRREAAIEVLASTLRSRDDAGSPARDRLDDVSGELAKLAASIDADAVSGTDPKRQLAEEIMTAKIFCDELAKAGRFKAVLKVVSASHRPDRQSDLDLRSLRISSPGRDDWLSKDGIELKPDDKDIQVDFDAQVEWGANAWNNYENAVEVAESTVATWQQNKVVSKPGGVTRLSLPKFHMKRKRSSRLELAVKIRVTDGTFLFSSRHHGKGNATFTVVELIDETKAVFLDRFDNKVRFSAKIDPKERTIGFKTREPAYDIELGLGAPVKCVLHRRLGPENWKETKTFALTTTPGPLAVLGLPLLRRGANQFSETLEVGGEDDLKVALSFSNLPQVPQLLWDVAGSVDRTRAGAKGESP